MNRYNTASLLSADDTIFMPDYVEVDPITGVASAVHIDSGRFGYPSLYELCSAYKVSVQDIEECAP